MDRPRGDYRTTIRYYRTLGLLDAPLGGYVKSFTDKHRLQLIAIRMYQALGLPLRRIRDELYGKSLEDLQKTGGGRRQGLAEPDADLRAAATVEQWTVIPLSDDFLLVSRQSRTVPAGVIQRLQRALKDVAAPPLTHDIRNM